MSISSPARTRPTSRADQLRDAERPELRVVGGRIPLRSTVPIVVLVLVVLLVSIIVPMVLNTQMAETSFAIREQQLQLNELEAESWSLQSELQQVSSPVALEKAARTHGMVPAGSLGFISLDAGTVGGGEAAR